MKDSRNRIKNHFRIIFLALAAGSGLLLAQNPTGASGVFKLATQSTEVLANDPNITYIGRWDRSQPQVAYGNWTGHYLRTKFTGTTVSVRLENATSLAVSIDGEPTRFVTANAGVTKLNEQPLNPGDHLLQVGSGGQNEEVAFEGLVLDADATTKPITPKPIIEFVGDSITTEFVGSNFAWLTAGMLGCDLTQISFSGVALTSGYGCLPDKVGQDTQYFRLKNFNHLQEIPQVPWNFSYTPKMVVILLGQNDQCGSAPSVAFTDSYIAFVGKIRAKFPVASIVMMRTYGGPYEMEIAAAAARLRQQDPKVHYVDTTGWLGTDDFRDGVHPTPGGHLKAARQLADVLAPILSGN